MDSTHYPVTARNKARRMRERASYDMASVYEILDSALICHIAYVVDGQPYCTPTTFWRSGNAVFWHGSVGSKMIKEQSKQIDVCLTVSFLDSIVLTRGAFGHAVNYRSAMLFGRAAVIEDPQQKEREWRQILDNFLPRRSESVVPPTALELKQVSLVRMPIDEAVAKVRNYPASHEPPEHRSHSVWAGEIPISLCIGEPVPCELLDPSTPKGLDLASYCAGDRFDEALLKIRRASAVKSVR